MIIYNKKLNEKNIQELIEKIKTGKYTEINESIIKKEIIKEIKNQPNIIDKITQKSVQTKIIKKIKTNLYRGIGMFNNQKSLKTHLSTKDRNYNTLNKAINLIENHTPIQSVVDLGCGLNPLSFFKLNIQPEYICYEINEKYVQKINEFFNENNIKGIAYSKDILTLSKLPNADLYLLLKLVDSIETKKGHKISETLINKIPSKYIIISFPTKTISGRPMNVPERRWIKLMMDRLGYKYEIISDDNEIYYVITK